jgi:hypothetical protein
MILHEVKSQPNAAAIVGKPAVLVNLGYVRVKKVFAGVGVRFRLPGRRDA